MCLLDETFSPISCTGSLQLLEHGTESYLTHALHKDWLTSFWIQSSSGWNCPNHREPIQRVGFWIQAKLWDRQLVRQLIPLNWHSNIPELDWYNNIPELAWGQIFFCFFLIAVSNDPWTRWNRLLLQFANSISLGGIVNTEVWTIK